jgi:hypothetical protein
MLARRRYFKLIRRQTVNNPQSTGKDSKANVRIHAVDRGLGLICVTITNAPFSPPSRLPSGAGLLHKWVDVDTHSGRCREHSRD